MILPPVITVFIFHYIPLYGVQIAFKDYRTSLGIWGSEWVGLKHFIAFIKYPYFAKVLRNTLVINLAGLLFFPASVILALMLNEIRYMKLRKVCQVVTYAPHFVSTVVVCSMVQLFLGREGLLGAILNLMGKDFVDVISSPGAFPWIYALSGLWQELGWGTVIYMATLSGVSAELVEAARIDGASRLRIIWHVYLPHLKPTIAILLIMQIGSMLNLGFEKVFLLQNPLNMEGSSVIATYTYEIGILKQRFSYSTAISLFNTLINIILVTTANTVSKKVTETGLW